jgi:hypothetical protein
MRHFPSRPNSDDAPFPEAARSEAASAATPADPLKEALIP